MQKYLTPNLVLPILLVAFAVLSRVLPHPPNFTAIGAVALFGAARLDKRWLAFLIPLVAMYISDLFINNVVYGTYYDHFVWQISPFVYAAFLLIMGIGFWLRKRVRFATVLGGSLLASVLFFLFTNAASWQIDPMYPKDIAGLGAAYLAGLPFLANTVAGDLFFSGILFGGYAWYQQRYGSPAVVANT